MSADPKFTPAQVVIPPFSLTGDLVVPPEAAALIIFAHGSGSSRLSPRNQFVASGLNRAGLATLLFDLLTVQEDRTIERRFDIPLLASRLRHATEWARRHSQTRALPIGYFGASTGSAAALIAAAQASDVFAVVSRGGRPDLAALYLSQVRAPVLLIVGERDERVLEWNRDAAARMGGECRLAIVAGATHLFEEPGALEEVAELARDWFLQHLPGRKPPLTPQS